MSASSTEGGIRDKRYGWLAEQDAFQLPGTRSWSPPSDNVTNFEWSPSPGVSLRRGNGTADVVEVHNGPEEHEVTVEYDMQQFPVDGSGNAQSLDGYGILRVSPNNSLPSTVAFMRREEKSDLSPNQTINGATSKSSRIFVVMKGGKIDEVEYSGDPGSEQPITVSVTITAEKVREYQIDQPDSGQTLDIASSDANDTMDLTLEDEGGNTTETISLNGTTTVTTTGSFSDIDAAELSADPQGDITISGSSSGDTLAVIRGADFYGHGEGDLGVPALEGGSQPSALGTSYETILGDQLERPSGTGVAMELNSVAFTVSNNVGTRERVSTPRMASSADDRNVEVTATIVGESESVKSAEEALAAVEQNVRWTLDGGYLQADNAPLTDFGGVTDESGESAMSLDNTFTGQGLTVSQ